MSVRAFSTGIGALALRDGAGLACPYHKVVRPCAVAEPDRLVTVGGNFFPVERNSSMNKMIIGSLLF